MGGTNRNPWSGVKPSNDPTGDDNFFENAAEKFPGTGLLGNLIFPESNSPTGKPDHGVFAPRTKVAARAELTIPVPTGMTARLQARVLDPDHFGTGDFDPNRTNQPDEPNQPNEPNLGKDNVKGRIKVGHVSMPLGMSDEKFEFLFESGLAMAFKQQEITEPQPANNWIIGVHDEETVADQFHISPGTGINIVRKFAGIPLIAIATTNESKVLTVGRSLWVEMDTMYAPTAAPGTPDDERLNKTPLDISKLTKLMSEALILVKTLPLSLDKEHDFMRFVKYFESEGGAAKADLIRDVKSEQYFWVVQIIDAFEHSAQFDNDEPGANSLGVPNTLDAGLWYAGYAHGPDNDQVNTIYHETIRDVHKERHTSDNTPGGNHLVDVGTHIQILVAHEVLHRFLGYHTPRDTPGALHNSNIMSYKVQYDESLAVLSGKQLRLIQNQLKP